MNLHIFTAAFLFIFVAALPGRTTFVMLVMAARGRPLGIFLGAALAFACQSFISVALGHFLSFLPQSWVQAATGVLFLFFAFLFWRESGMNHDQEKSDIGDGTLLSAMRSSFLLIFMAEWGDISQVAIASFSARHAEQMTVFISAVLALWLIAAMAIAVGARLHRVMDPKGIQKLASLIFMAIGIYLIAGSVFHI